jgi:hypothetical protein
MSVTNMSGTILIRENTPLPAGSAIESEVFLPGWKVVKHLDGFELARNIEGANWNFFYLAGEMRATVLGRDRPAALRRAVKRILAKQEQQFNSLAITRVASKRFLGIPFLTVAAHSRHIQQDICLVPAKDFDLGIPVPATRESSLGSGKEDRQADVPTTQYAAITSSS